MNQIILRRLHLPEIETLIGWAAAEGWNPGLSDAAAFQAADPDGFIGCFVDGIMTAGISAVRYGESFGFIGLYIAHPKFRGRGYGRRVWDAGMAHLDGRTIGLDGVPQQQANYRTMGFAADHVTDRWTGIPDGRPDATVRRITEADVHSLIDFDGRHFAGPRPKFLRQWIKAPRQTRLLHRDGMIAGYAVQRQCRDGYKIGPIFAEDTAAASALLRACAAETPGEVLHIDVPAYQLEFSRRLADEGFSRGFQTTRMYRGHPHSCSAAGIFAITTLELG